MKRPRLPTLPMLAIDLALAAALLALLATATGDSVLLLPETWIGPLVLYLAAALGFTALNRPVYGFVPPLVGKGERVPLRPRYLPWNLHALLLVALVGAAAFQQAQTIPVEEDYPVVRGNIVVVVKNNGKIINSGAGVERANAFGYDLSLHVLQNIKKTVNEMAMDSAQAAIRAKEKQTVEGWLRDLGRLNLGKLAEGVNQRIRYQGKPPIMLYNVRVLFYSAAGLDASLYTQTRTDDTWRQTPSISDWILVKDGFRDDDMKMSEIPRMRRDLPFPDSLNFLRHFYAKGLEGALYGDQERAAAMAAARLDPPSQAEPPTSPPVLIWLSDDGVDWTPLAQYPDPAGPRGASALVRQPELLKDRFFRGFLSSSCLVYYQGLQQYMTDPGLKAQTFLRNLDAERFFTEVIRMPPVRYLDARAFAADRDRALQDMHASLADFIRAQQGRGLATSVETITNAAKAFSYFSVFMTIILPAFLWIMLMSARHLFLARWEED